MSTQVKSFDTRRPALASPAPGRVLHVNSGNLYGGVETILVTSARLREHCPGMEPHFALCHEGRLSEELKEAGVAVYQVGNVRISRPWTVWRARRRFGEILRGIHFDMVICHMPWSLSVFGGAVKNAGQRIRVSGRTLITTEADGWSVWRAVLPRTWQLRTAALPSAGWRIFSRPPRISSDIFLVTLAPLWDAAQTRALLRQQLGVADETVVDQVSRIEAGPLCTSRLWRN